MAELRVGYGASLEKYRTESVENPNLDITIETDNGDMIEVNTRKGFGYTIRLKEKNKAQKIIKNVDYEKKLKKVV